MDLPGSEPPGLFSIKPQLVIGVPAAMPDPLTAKEIFPGHPKTCHRRILLKNLSDFKTEILRYPFIGVDIQDPGSLGLVLGAVFLSGKTLPGFLKNLGLKFFRDGPGQIPAPRIHHYDFIGEPHAFQAFPDIPFFI
jgi:hypothetical protein